MAEVRVESMGFLLGSGCMSYDACPNGSFQWIQTNVPNSPLFTCSSRTHGCASVPETRCTHPIPETNVCETGRRVGLRSSHHVYLS
ncbi:hypothetical protein AAFF_G00366610 [Aldrovandia affinis]|uniref:Uncharacterized protein n=1 Tax=Aldrovandia affinis TaxID=143900 RepID=A0AAD7SHF6_9TELE|nr:hypothetical protein AAFF_G00366610 [Aldrovandia affinis]